MREPGDWADHGPYIFAAYLVSLIAVATLIYLRRQRLKRLEKAVSKDD